MSSKLSERQKKRILARLEEIESKINQIQRDLDVMMQIHEMLHPEELERAREQVDGSPKED